MPADGFAETLFLIDYHKWSGDHDSYLVDKMVHENGMNESRHSLKLKE